MLAVVLFVVALMLMLAVAERVARAQRVEARLLVRVDERRRRARR